MTPDYPWVADLGVLLNLAAVERPGQLIEELALTLMIPRVGLGTLRHPRTRKRVADLDHLGLSCVRVIPLSPEEYDLMVELASPPNGVDDGEAAMLAVAETRGLGCLVDDPKVLALFNSRQRRASTLSTLALLRAGFADGRISEARTADALQSAIEFAGLTVTPEHAEWAAGLLGKKDVQRSLW